MNKYYKYIFAIGLLLSCNTDKSNSNEKPVEPLNNSLPQNNSSKPSSESENKISNNVNDNNENLVGFDDRTYNAKVQYYNPNTGKRSHYNLEVEVENNTVTVIHFSNGGWLDETHIVSGGELDEEGTTTIHSDKGYEFTVTIIR